MPGEISVMKYEFFSRKGSLVGVAIIVLTLIIQSLLGFPEIWIDHPIAFPIFIAFSAITVGVTSGSVLVYLYPPDQDVIGIAGLGNDDATQHMSLFLVVVALIQPIVSGFIFFYDYFEGDPLIAFWVLVTFSAPAFGLAVAMFDRANVIAEDLRIYFENNERLDMVTLDWLHGLGPRTAVYRMGMLESAAGKVEGLKIDGHEIIRVNHGSIKN
jgi:hypothetical protein